MATMMKEKRREVSYFKYSLNTIWLCLVLFLAFCAVKKYIFISYLQKKKSKEKQAPRTNIEQEQLTILNVVEHTEDSESLLKETENLHESSQATLLEPSGRSTKEVETISSTVLTENTAYSTDTSVLTKSTDSTMRSDIAQEVNHISVTAIENNNFIHMQSEQVNNATDTYENLNRKLDRMSIPEVDVNLPLEDLERNVESHEHVRQDTVENKTEESEVTPSAPVLEEVIQGVVHQKKVVVPKEIVPKVECMPLEEAMRVYGGAEMAEVRAMGEREEAIVEAGPLSGPEHPLVDLLSTFR